MLFVDPPPNEIALVPPLEVAPKSLRGSRFVVSDRARPLSDEGWQVPQLCWPRQFPASAGDGCRFRHPLRPTLLLHPWKCPLLTPSLAPPIYLSRAIALRGSQLPTPSVRGIGGSHTRGMREVLSVALAGDILEGVRPRAAKSDRWHWMVGRRGEDIGGGGVVIAS
jgi:hypothetical protein